MRREENIDRTEEYNRFMERLEAFHQKHGSTLTREPVLGSQRLDLLKVYKLVTSNGGFEKVTQERGWKKITLPFNFPPTCTNSAYVMKIVYVKNLELFEQEDFWGKTVPVNKFDQPTEAAAGATRSREASQVPQAAKRTYQQQQQQQHQHQQQQQPPPPPPVKIPQPPPPVPQPVIQHNMPRSSGYKDGYYVDGGHKNRVLLALKSGLPNEIDWAFNRMIELSFEWDEFSPDHIPGLMDQLLIFADPLFDWWSTIEKRVAEDLTEDDLVRLNDTYNLERILQVFHILRNFSCLDRNIYTLTNHAKFRKMLQVGLTLPTSPQLNELRIYCLETLESLSVHITLRSKFDVYLQQLHRMLSTNDRALILGSLRALTRLAVNEHNEKFLTDIDPDIIERTSQLLLTQDEEMIGATLDYIYQYSSFHGDAPLQIAKNFPGNIVSVLVRFLSHGSPRSVTPAPIVDPAQQIMHEPYRALHWLQSNFDTSPQAWIFESDLFGLYQTKFQALGPMLRSADLITVARVGFPLMEASYLQEEGATPRQVIRGIARKPWIDFGSEEKLKCRWTGCSMQVLTEAELFQHTAQDHVPIYPTGMMTIPQYTCNWLSCHRFTEPVQDRKLVLRHIKTHFPLTPSVKPFSNRPRWFDMRPNVLEVPGRELAGIPLTAVCVLRNLSKHKRNQKLFLPYEESLARIMGEFPKMAGFIVDILSFLRVG